MRDTRRYLRMALMGSGEIIETAGERRCWEGFPLKTLKDPFTGEMLLNDNELVDEAIAEKLGQGGNRRVVKIRSVLSCRSKHGICANCYGAICSRSRCEYG